MELSFPPAQAGRSSRSSGRARHTSKIGAPRDHSAMCSMRSRKVGSPQFTSSSTTTSGRSRANASKNFRTAQKLSSPPRASASPTSSETRAATRVASSSSARNAAIRPRASSGGLLAVQGCGLANDLGYGPKRDAVPVREAATPNRRCLFGQIIEEFRHEARLSNPGRTHEGEEVTALLTLNPGEGIV